MQSLARASRRLYSTKALIPPNLAPSTQAAGANAKQTADLAFIIDLYAKLPKGPAPVTKPRGLFARYHERYISTSSATPLLHVILIIGTLGYAIQYHTHLSK